MLWVRQNPGKPKDAMVRVRHKDGGWHWAEITMRNLLSEPGVGAIISTLRDITDRKQAQEALEESENKFRDLVEKAIVGVYLLQDHVFIYVNAKCAEIHGYGDPTHMNGLEIRGTISLRTCLRLTRRKSGCSAREKPTVGSSGSSGKTEKSGTSRPSAGIRRTEASRRS